jgi:methionyl-tRNA formyltransferase
MVLKYLIDNHLTHFLRLVVVGTDKNVINDYSLEIISACNVHGITWCYYKDIDLQNISEFSIAVSWNRIIDTNNTKLIVIHDSILPKYRGFAPLINQLLNKEPEIGVTAFQAVGEYDKGDIIFQEVFQIDYPIKIKNAIELVSVYYQKILSKVFNAIVNGEDFIVTPQQEQYATYSLWRDGNDYFINWQKDSDYISRFVDSVGDPYLGAKTYIDNELITISESIVVNDLNIENRDCGKVIFFQDSFPVVVCGSGLLKITDAFYNSNGKSIFPLNKFRLRFGLKGNMLCESFQ